jgi:hypothetical protein
MDRVTPGDPREDGDELEPLRRPPASADVLLERWRTLPRVDPDELRADVDRVLDPSL